MDDVFVCCIFVRLFVCLYVSCTYLAPRIPGNQINHFFASTAVYCTDYNSLAQWLMLWYVMLHCIGE